jgi:hypothetical protein
MAVIIIDRPVTAKLYLQLNPHYISIEAMSANS